LPPRAALTLPESTRNRGGNEREFESLPGRRINVPPPRRRIPPAVGGNLPSQGRFRCVTAVTRRCRRGVSRSRGRRKLRKLLRTPSGAGVVGAPPVRYTAFWGIVPLTREGVPAMHPMEGVARLAEWAGPDLAYNLDFIPEDRLNWKPAPES